MKITDLFFENPSLLLMMEHFDLNFILNNKTVEEVCRDNNINKELFISIANLYNGFLQVNESNLGIDDLNLIIKFLRNSHQYYINEKYPEISSLIDLVHQENDTPEIKLVKKFVREYFEDVAEHLDYEDKTVFPYFLSLVSPEAEKKSATNVSVKIYSEHHSDIESKLDEIKNLLLKHITLKNDRKLRRKLLLCILELENDLQIHSIIEEKVLMPLISKVELHHLNEK